MKVHHSIAQLFGYELLNLRKHHPTLEYHLKTLLENLAIDVVIDVGANKGQYGVMLRHIGFKGEIHSFEPVTASFKQLQKTAQNDGNWKVYQCALGEENTEISINITTASEFASLLDVNDYAKTLYGEKVPVIETELVRVRVLDDVFEGDKLFQSRRVFLKMDTQGYDLSVLKGAQSITNHILALQSEISIQPLYEGMPDYMEALAEFRKKGFELTGLYPVSRDPGSSILIEMDCVMKKIE